MARVRRFVFPFSAIVGQEKMKKALLLNAINPRIGGVLIRGDKGTAKSTAVRALADLLPEIEVVKGCPFNCNPRDPREMCPRCLERFEKGEELPSESRKVKIVDLPLNATADRVVGSINVEKAIREGVIEVVPGLLAEANRGILYIDEVNLLDDYIVDIILDAAASGVNVIEREGVSFAHPARFILVGTMNPEEGELRPQLLDRFGLIVDVEVIKEPKLRVEIIKRVEEFESDPLTFIKKWEPKQEELRRRIKLARELLSKVEISDDLLEMIAEVCSKLGVSHRAEIVTVRTAKTLAAFNGRTKVTFDDVVEALELALPHRLKKRPFEKPPRIDKEFVEKILNSQKPDGDGDGAHSHQHQFFRSEVKSGSAQSQGVGNSTVYMPPTPAEVDTDVLAILERLRRAVGGSGRGVVVSGVKQGAYIYARVPRRVDESVDIAIDATLRAAALRCAGKGALEVALEDIREKVRRRRARRLVTIVLDLSGSMLSRSALARVKYVLLELLKELYTKRDIVSLITFRGKEAKVEVEPTRNLEAVAEAVKRAKGGGRTPLTHALALATDIVARFKPRMSSPRPVILLVTDGKANVALRRSIEEEILELCKVMNELKCKLVILDTLPSRVITPSKTYINLLLENVSDSERIRVM